MLALNEPITAAITGDSLCTYALLRAFKVVGLHLPFIGFDDFPLADLLEPGISVIEQNPYDIGRVATQLLFRRIGGDTSPPQTIKLGTRLIQRGSGETGLQSTDGSLHTKLE
jgi:Transcriptional regulators